MDGGRRNGGGGREEPSSFEGADYARSGDLWTRETYAKASTMSPRTTTRFLTVGKPSLLWLTIVVLVILNSVLFVLYLLDAIGVGFRSPLTLVTSSGVLFVLFCILSVYAAYRFKYERVMEDWLSLLYITVIFTVVNLAAFLTFLIWALQHPEFWKEVDFDDNPKAHDGYVAANAFAAAFSNRVSVGSSLTTSRKPAIVFSA